MRPRFSLRLFLIAFTLLAIALGAAANFVYRIKTQARRHKAAVEKLQSLGVRIELEQPEYWPTAIKPTPWELFVRKWVDKDAYKRAGEAHVDYQEPYAGASEALEYLPEVSGLHTLRFHDLVLNDETCAQLARLPYLNTLSVARFAIAPTAASRLQTLQSVTQLRTRYPLTDETAEGLASIPHLQDLTLNVSQLTERGAKALSALKRLQRVEIVFDSRAARPGPKSLAALLQCEKLAELHLSLPADAEHLMEELKHAGRIKVFSVSKGSPLPKTLCQSVAQMKSLEVFGVRVSSHSARAHGISALTNCQELRDLDLLDVELDASHLRQLAPLKNLRSLRCCGEFPQQELINFLRAHPLCEIDLRYPGSDYKSAAGCKYKLVSGELNSEKYNFAGWP